MSNHAGEIRKQGRSIYALCDPHFSGPQAIYYVGIAKDPLCNRLAGHWRAAAHVYDESHRCVWLRALLSLGLDVEVVILEDNADEDREAWWIAEWLRLGAPLTNTEAWVPEPAGVQMPSCN